MKPARRAELAARLRDCGEQEMVELLEAELHQLDSEVVRLALRNPHASKRVVDLVLGERRLLASHEIQKELAQHPRTPESRVLNLVPALYWSDLVELGGNTRTRPRIRLAADRRLLERLPRLGAGERVAIARRAGPGVAARLLFDADPRVVEALLENPRLTESLLAPAIHSEVIRPETLALIAVDRKWGRRYSVRNGIARNPRTAVATALDQLAYLQKSDLREVWSDPRIEPEVRRKAGLLLGIDPGASELHLTVPATLNRVSGRQVRPQRPEPNGLRLQNRDDEKEPPAPLARRSESRRRKLRRLAAKPAQDPGGPAR